MTTDSRSMRGPSASEMIDQCVSQLKKSERGRSILRDLHSFLAGGYLGSDYLNGEAVAKLLLLAHRGLAGRVIEAIDPQN